MNGKIIYTNRIDFNAICLIDENGKEIWMARDLMEVLGYETWEAFHKVIKKAMISMKKSYPQIKDHFLETTKMIKIASGTIREALRPTIDYKLTRYACYLIAQNGDPSKEQIALAQSYFAYQTRQKELEEDRTKNIERIMARRKLRETEKKFSGVLTNVGLTGNEIAEIRSKGDEALFNMTTSGIKSKLGIK